MVKAKRNDDKVEILLQAELGEAWIVEWRKRGDKYGVVILSKTMPGMGAPTRWMTLQELYETMVVFKNGIDSLVATIRFTGMVETSQNMTDEEFALKLDEILSGLIDRKDGDGDVRN